MAILEWMGALFRLDGIGWMVSGWDEVKSTNTVLIISNPSCMMYIYIFLLLTDKEKTLQ